MANPKGRPKGSLNKRRGAREACEAIGVDVFQYMAMVVKGDVPCNVCRQRLKTKVLRKDVNTVHMRDCQSCKGDGWEKLSPETRLRAAEGMGRWLEPQLQAMQVSGPEGEPIAIRVIFGKE